MSGAVYPEAMIITMLLPCGCRLDLFNTSMYGKNKFNPALSLQFDKRDISERKGAGPSCPCHQKEKAFIHLR